MIVFPPFFRQHLFPIIFGPFFGSIYSHNLAAFPNHIFSIFPVLFLFKMGRQFLLFSFLLSLLLVGIYAQGVCVHQGKQYRNGDEWTYRSFIMRCDVYHNYWQTKVVACLSLMGQRIPVGGQIQDRHGVWKCIQDPSGSTRLVQE